MLQKFSVASKLKELSHCIPRSVPALRHEDTDVSHVNGFWRLAAAVITWVFFPNWPISKTLLILWHRWRLGDSQKCPHPLYTCILQTRGVGKALGSDLGVPILYDTKYLQYHPSLTWSTMSVSSQREEIIKNSPHPLLTPALPLPKQISGYATASNTIEAGNINLGTPINIVLSTIKSKTMGTNHSLSTLITLNLASFQKLPWWETKTVEI